MVIKNVMATIKISQDLLHPLKAEASWFSLLVIANSDQIARLAINYYYA
jgi:hypothetical protein